MTISILRGDCREVLKTLPPDSFHTCVTSPPYFRLRAYLPDGHPDKAFEMGSETTPADFVEALVEVFQEVRRVLRDDGTVWLNLGDSRAGSWGNQGQDNSTSRISRRSRTAVPKVKSGAGAIPPGSGLKAKDLMGLPWEVALALRRDGWFLRQDIIWAKANPQPESVTDRCTTAHEYIFLLSKRATYYFDAAAIREPASGNAHARRAAGAAVSISDKTDGASQGVKNNRSFVDAVSDEVLDSRNKRSVWTVVSEPSSIPHFAGFPTKLIEPCILAGCPMGGAVLDPFGGTGTTGLVAERLGRDATLIELNDAYATMADQRLRAALAQVEGRPEVDASDLPLFAGAEP